MVLARRLDILLARYPRQFRLLLGGECISIIGRSMVFLTLYLHGRLGVPVTARPLLQLRAQSVSTAGLRNTQHVALSRMAC